VRKVIGVVYLTLETYRKWDGVEIPKGLEDFIQEDFNAPCVCGGKRNTRQRYRMFKLCTKCTSKLLGMKV